MKNKWIKAIIVYSICVLVSACSITDEDRMRWAREAKERDLQRAEEVKREERDRLARKQWQYEQELNLEYVAITRAMSELIDVSAPA